MPPSMPLELCHTLEFQMKISTMWLASKSRLAPLKTTTIPKLELAAAVEATKLDNMLRKELEIPLMESIF